MSRPQETSGSDQITPLPEGEAGYERCRREHGAVFEIAKVLAASSDLETLLNDLMERLVNVLEPADAGALVFYHPDRNRLVVEVAYGITLDPERPWELPVGAGLSGKAFQSQATQVFATPEETWHAMADAGPEEVWHMKAASGGLEQPRSAIAAPLISGDQVMGTLTLANFRKPGYFSQADVPFVTAIADLVALAVDRARLAEAAEQARVLEEANRLKSELISTLAHEMRTPLASIRGYATALLMDETEWDRETQQEFLEIIDEECYNLSELISDLLETSIIEAGFLHIEKQPTLVPRLAEQAVDEMRPRTRKHRFLISFPPAFPVVDADPQRMAQVLHNLLDNAVKYSPHGGLIVVRGEVGEDEMIVSVADQGIGIAPEHLNRLFEKYFRVKSALGRRVVGTGLGLPIARTIVESHGGRIWAESKLGEGSTFYFTLPLGGLSSEPEADD
jgi:signal transduction histidine kinase